MSEPIPSPSHILDAKGLVCPLPVLRARKLLKAMAEGEILLVEATDRSAPADFAAFCATTGWRLLRSDEAEGVFRFAILRSGDGSVRRTAAQTTELS